MTIEVLYRVPSLEYITVVVDGTNNVLEKEQYNKIITPATRVGGTGRDYLDARNKLLEEYFNPKPKELYEW